jgi:hypothetical protein
MPERGKWERVDASVGSARLRTEFVCLHRTQRLIDILFELVQFGSIAEALAALYAYESQVPGLAVHMSCGSGWSGV